MSDVLPVTIEKHASANIIRNYRIGDIPKLEHMFSLWDKNTFRYVYDAYEFIPTTTSDSEDDTEPIIGDLYLPGGINITEVSDMLVDFYPEVYTVDSRKIDVNTIPRLSPSVTCKDGYKPRNKLQEDATVFLRFKSMDALQGQKMLNLNTGDGKTFCAIYSIVQSQRVPLIMVDQKRLASQWKTKFLEYTNLEEDQVYIFSGKSSITKFMKMSQEEVYSYKAFIGLYTTLKNNLYWEDLPLSAKPDGKPTYREFREKTGISVLVYDEIHIRYQAAVYLDIVMNTVPSIYMTATPARNNRLENRLFQNIFCYVPKMNSTAKVNYSYNKITTTGSYGKYITVSLIKFSTHPSENEIINLSKASKRRGFKASEYKDYLLNPDKPSHKEYFVQAVYQVLWSLALNKGESSRRVLILLKNIDLIKEVQTYLKEKDELKDLLILPYYGGVSTKDKKKAIADADIILSTDSSVGKGSDIPDLQVVISTINTGSEVSLKQMSGRLRKLPDKDVFIFIDLVDYTFSEIRSQYTKKLKFFKAIAKDVFTLDIR